MRCVEDVQHMEGNRMSLNKANQTWPADVTVSLCAACGLTLRSNEPTKPYREDMGLVKHVDCQLAEPLATESLVEFERRQRAESFNV
jgi:hypothetical protein